MSESGRQAGGRGHVRELVLAGILLALLILTTL